MKSNKMIESTGSDSVTRGAPLWQRLLGVAYAGLCYLIFLGTFHYAIGFLSGFAVPKSVDSEPHGPLAEALAMDLLLLGLFAVQHSVMARPGFKRWWTRVLPPAVERSTYVLVSSLLLALLFWQWRSLPGLVWEIDQPALRTALWGLCAGGWVVVLISTLLIDHFDLFGLRQAYLYARCEPYMPPPFRTLLLYRIVRHPIMLGFLVAFWATPTMTWGHLLFSVMTTAYIIIGVHLEERDLRAAHPGSYADYKRRVPMLVPWRLKVDVAAQPVKTVYDSLAATYDRRWHRYIDLSLTKVIETLALTGDERILDVACGTGELERRLLALQPGLHLTGVDLSPKMLAEARSKRLSGDVSWVEGEASQAALADDGFDVVICASSFHYFRGPTDCLTRFRHCLAPGGTLVMLDWCDDYWMCKLCSLWLRLTDRAFYRIYTAQTCRSMLQAAGFAVVHEEQFRAGWPWGLMLFVCSKKRAVIPASVT
jgi:protein-S-isoprenylcysteine O-methyltransferase Ste14/ubiquinone/menaquinone biosynthesis C-methylase UbiE